MAAIPFSLACWRYDRTAALIDGRVKPAGLALDVRVMRPRLAFERMLTSDALDASEMSLSSFISLKAQGDDRLVAIPVMLSKIFRHDAIYVRRDAGVRTPRDLIGKRVGTMRYTSTALVFIRGLFRDDYGVETRDIEWFVGGVNEPMTSVRPPDVAGDVRMTIVSDATTLDAMLERGELDALFTQDMPASFVAGAPHIARLFVDFKQAEADYHRRTGVFPTMHTVAIRSDVHRRAPGAARALFDAFLEAKRIATHDLYDTDALHLSLPFLIDHLEETRRVFGADPFAYGLEPNRATLATLCRYLHEQGLAPRLMAPDDLFVDVS